MCHIFVFCEGFTRIKLFIATGCDMVTGMNMPVTGKP